jgi:hypothetical protein
MISTERLPEIREHKKSSPGVVEKRASLARFCWSPSPAASPSPWTEYRLDNIAYYFCRIIGAIAYKLMA